MKKIIRTGVFETNSSSAHSITLAKANQEFVLDTIYPDQNGIVRVQSQDFGWEYNAINDPLTKLAYAFQDSPENNHELIKRVVRKQTGASEVIFEDTGGYIDHQSVGTTEDFRGDEDEMRNFIFNKNSWLFTGNDNSEPDPTFYDVPEYKGGRMILPEYKYELVIDGLDQTTKFKSYPDMEDLEQGINSLIDHHTLVTEDGNVTNDDNIWWHINRPRDRFYKMDWHLEQDFSKKQILFLKENDNRWNEIDERVNSDTELKDKSYWEKAEHKTKEALAVEGLVKVVKFNINEI